MGKESDGEILLYIGGMTCVNCQNKIEKALKSTAGILSAAVSYEKGTAEISYDKKKISLQEITAIIEKLDYQVLRKGKNQKPNFMRVVVLLAIIVLLYIILQTTGLLNLLVPGQLADSGMGYGMLFVIGLITSVHCIAMCGGINLLQCLPASGQMDEKGGKLAYLRPSFLYNLGRIVSYTAMGFLFGLVGLLFGGGQGVGLGTVLQGFLKIIVGIFMVIMGINMLGIFPALRKFNFRVPRFIANKVGEEKARSRRPFFVGILNGFMPCGPLQSMWLVALASGNPFSGALSMFLFSLGTVPLMLGLGSVVSSLGKKFADKVMTVGAVLVVVLGLAMLSQGGALSGWLSPQFLLILIIVFAVSGVIVSIPTKSEKIHEASIFVAVVIIIGTVMLWNSRKFVSDNTQEVPETAETEVEIQDGVQVVNSTLESGKYPNITVQVGVPVKWIIDAPEGSINGCNYRMVIQDLGLEYDFQTGENVIEFTAEETGTIRYTCWMGMIRGNIFVTDGTEAGAVAVGDVTVPTPSGYSIPTDELAIASVSTDAQGSPIQEVSIRLTDQGFEPAIVVVQEGVYTSWHIEVDLENGDVGQELLAPYYSTILTLDSGDNSLSLYPTEDFDVASGDYRAFAYVKVVDDLENVDEDAVRAEVAEYEPIIYPAELYAGAGMSCCN